MLANIKKRSLILMGVASFLLSLVVTPLEVVVSKTETFYAFSVVMRNQNISKLLLNGFINSLVYFTILFVVTLLIKSRKEKLNHE